MQSSFFALNYGTLIKEGEQGMEKPDWILNFNRPAGTEIKHINGHWYLYERKGVYDKITKTKRKKSGRCLGAITEIGLKPSKFASPHSPISALAGKELENLEFGATSLLWSLTEEMRKRLQQRFPTLWREIYALALLKCKEQSCFRRMEFFYETSFLAQMLPNLSLSAGRINEIIAALGADRASIKEYMKDDLPSKGVVLFDGHRILSSSDTLEFAHVGYDSKCRFMPQVNLLYMFSVQEGQVDGESSRKFPVFYKQYSGDVPDVAAFADMVADSGLRKRDVVVVADKGFESGANEQMLSCASLGYVLAVRRGSNAVPEIPAWPDKYQSVFSYRDRVIYASAFPCGEEIVYLYYDMELAKQEARDLVLREEKANNTRSLKLAMENRRRAKGKCRLTQEEFERLKPVNVADKLQEHRTTGTFILKTNRKDINCAQAYYLYKTRQDIEQSFKFFDNTLDAKGSYMQSDVAFEGWLFINHLSLQMLYSIICYISTKELSTKYSFEDLLQYLKQVRVNKIEGAWVATKMTKRTAKSCEDLNIAFRDPNSLLGSLK